MQWCSIYSLTDVYSHMFRLRLSPPYCLCMFRNFQLKSTVLIVPLLQFRISNYTHLYRLWNCCVLLYGERIPDLSNPYCWYGVYVSTWKKWESCVWRGSEIPANVNVIDAKVQVDRGDEKCVDHKNRLGKFKINCQFPCALHRTLSSRHVLNYYSVLTLSGGG
jgi:hypothetical protein